MILKELKQKLGVPRNTILQLVDMGKIAKLGNQYEIIDKEYFETFTLEKHRSYIKEQMKLKISQKNRDRYASLSEEEKLLRKQKISASTKNAMKKPEVYEKFLLANNCNRQKIADSVKAHWSNMTDEDYKLRCNSIKQGLVNMPLAKRKAMIASMKESLKRLYSDSSYLEIHRKRIKDGMTEEVCKKISERTSKGMLINDAVEKAVKTKKKNGTINYSKPAEDSIDLTSDIFSAIELEKAYPGLDNHYHCDMYVKDIDLWIEFNFTWTHGGGPYDENEQWCIEQLNRWKEKAKTSQYYAKAIEVWTKSDVKRSQIAKEYNLNWIAFYNLEDFKQWLNSIQ